MGLTNKVSVQLSRIVRSSVQLYQHHHYYHHQQHTHAHTHTEAERRGRGVILPITTSPVSSHNYSIAILRRGS